MDNEPMTKEQIEILKEFFIANAECGVCKELGCFDDCKKQKLGCLEFLQKWMEEHKCK